MKNRFVLRVLLPLLLVLSQVGGVAHELTHLARASAGTSAPAPGSHRDGLPVDQGCALCAAFAQVAAGAAPSLPILAPVALPAERSHAPAARGIGRPLRLAFHSRAPPAAL